MHQKPFAGWLSFTLRELEEAFAVLKLSKAPGIDGISPEVLELAPGRFAQLVRPLAVMMDLRKAEPLRGKCVSLLKLHKVGKSPRSTKPGRAAQFGDAIARAARTVYRAKVGPKYGSYAPSTQRAGGQRGADFAVRVGWLLDHVAATMHAGPAKVFMGIIAALHSITPATQT